VALDWALRAAESARLVIAAVPAPDVVSTLLQLVATIPPDERDVGRIRLAAALQAVAAQRLVPGEGGVARRPVVEWLEATDPLRAALLAGADATAIRKAMDKAVKEGRGETFAHAEAN
jgi:Tfp pilus assembly pilus retraction ATPase PilT